MHNRRLVFGIFLVVLFVGVLLIIAPSVVQMNENAAAINRAIEAQRQHN